MNIDTGGRYTRSDETRESVEALPIGGNPVIFDPTSTYEVSGLVVVHPGTQILVTAYNLAEKARIVVHGASVGQRPIRTGAACGPTGDPTPSGRRKCADVLFRSPMRLGGRVWELTPDCDRLLISLPGNYVFVLNDPAYFGDLQVEYQRMPLQPMPDVYYAGAGAPPVPVKE